MRQPQRTDWWSYAYLVVLAVGIPAAAYHIYSGRYGNALMALGAVVMGGIVYALERRRRVDLAVSAAPPMQAGRAERLPKCARLVARTA